MFAIAASSFSRPSETFIRDHALTIAPGETILLCHEPPPPELDALPALAGLDLGAWPRTPSRLKRNVRTVRRYWRRYAHPVLSERDKRLAVKFLEQHRPAALLAEYGPTGVMMLKPANLADTPLFVHFHGFDASVMTRFLLWRARYRRLFERAAGVIAPSQFVADILAAAGCPAGKLHVCACGIDPLCFSSSERQPFRLLSVGRLVKKKAPHKTIEAFAKIADRFPEARLDIVGAGPLEKQCRRLVASLDLGDRVTLHGAQSHDFVAALMRRTSIFVQHSVTSPWGDVEGMPVSILEAMASALPVVATRHSGIQEAVEHGRTGLLVEEHDIHAMAESIAVLFNDPARAKEMGAAGRSRVLDHYTQEKSREKLRAVMRL